MNRPHALFTVLAVGASLVGAIAAQPPAEPVPATASSSTPWPSLDVVVTGPDTSELPEPVAKLVAARRTHLLDEVGPTYRLLSQTIAKREKLVSEAKAGRNSVGTDIGLAAELGSLERLVASSSKEFVDKAEKVLAERPQAITAKRLVVGNFGTLDPVKVVQLLDGPEKYFVNVLDTRDLAKSPLAIVTGHRLDTSTKTVTKLPGIFLVAQTVDYVDDDGDKRTVPHLVAFDFDTTLGQIKVALPPLPALPAVTPPSRTWADATGQFKLQAYATDVTGGAVHLIDGAGVARDVPVTKLSPECQAWARAENAAKSK